MDGNFSQYIGDANQFNHNIENPIKIYFKGLNGYSNEDKSGIAILEDISEQKRIERLKTEFVSTVSHELRTPLTAIKGSIDLLEAVDSDTRVDLISMLKRNSSRLVYLINDLLDIDKIVSGNMDFDFKYYSAMDLINQAVSDNQTYAKEYNTNIVIGSKIEDVRIYVDAHRFIQALTNLLSNAAKFTRENTDVTVDVFTEGREILIKVNDQGEGIPDSFKDKLFQRFTQVDSSTTRKVGGTGLGLYITKKLVEIMQGSITFESVLGEGTTFIVRFPICEDDIKNS